MKAIALVLRRVVVSIAAVAVLTTCAEDAAVPVADPPTPEKAPLPAVKDLDALLAMASRYVNEKDNLEVGKAVSRLEEEAPVDWLRKHHDQVHRIGWVNPAFYYRLLLKAGTTPAERERLRTEFGVSDAKLAKYGDRDDVSRFLKGARAEIEACVAKVAATKEEYFSGIRGFGGLVGAVDIGIDDKGPMAEFFVECLNSPLTFPYADGGRVSLAYLAASAYAQKYDHDLWLLVCQRLRMPEDPKSRAEHQAAMRKAEKYMADKYGWRVSFQAPYLISGWERETRSRDK